VESVAVPRIVPVKVWLKSAADSSAKAARIRLFIVESPEGPSQSIQQIYHWSTSGKHFPIDYNGNS
jgi:hypothetical protein